MKLTAIKNSSPAYWAIVPAAGIGARIASDIPKQYLKIHDVTLLEHSINCLASHSKIKKIIVVLQAQDQYWEKISLKFPDKIVTVIGGEQRCHSVFNGLLELQKLAAGDDWVLVHDAARPCLQHEDINKLINQIAAHPVGGLLGVKVRDTLKHADATGKVLTTVSRENVWQALTPQMFRFEKIFQALQSALQKNILVSDEAAAIELMGESPILVEGRQDNIKITYPEDLLLAEKNMQTRKIYV